MDTLFLEEIVCLLNHLSRHHVRQFVKHDPAVFTRVRGATNQRHHKAQVAELAQLQD